MFQCLAKMVIAVKGMIKMKQIYKYKNCKFIIKFIKNGYNKLQYVLIVGT